MVLALAGAAACSDALPPDALALRQRDAAMSAALAAEESATVPGDIVDLTLYFRRGRGDAAHLAPVTRQTPVTADLPRAALEQLLAGPTAGDPAGLAPALPATIALRSFALEGDAAVVDLAAPEIASAAAPRPQHAVLAMAALVNTLTEFPTIQRVRLTVDGEANARLWGGWRVPDELVRDDSVLASEKTNESLPDGAGFDRRPQRLGATLEAPVSVADVRAGRHAGFDRIVVELDSRGAAERAGDNTRVPRATARPVPGGVVLAVRDVVSADISTLGRVGAVLGDGRVSVSLNDDVLVVRWASPRAGPHWLHTLPEPRRIVLDLQT